MVAFAFNAAQHTPQYGGGGGLPANEDGTARRYKVVIVESSQENVEKNGMVVGGYLGFTLTPVEGPLAGVKHTDRLNLHNTNPKTVEIANKQLSAYCHVLNKHQFNDTAELHNIPFFVDIGLQKDPNPNKYTEVKAIFDINGNEPGKAGSGPAPQQQQQPNIPQQPAGGVVAQGGQQGWGQPQGAGQPQQGGNFGGPQPDPNAGFNGGFAGGGQPQQGAGQPAIDNNVPMPGGPQGGQPQQGWGQQGGAAPQGQQGQGGWGQPQGGAPQGQPQGQPQQGGWQQNGAPQGGGGPAWGQR